jgi:ankyrin repeat protein
MEDEVVQILHHSFTEFLLDAGRLSAGTPQFPVIDPTIAHRDIATTCLASLREDGFRDYSDDNRAKGEFKGSGSAFRSDGFDFRSVYLQYPLMEYAARNCPYHAKRYDKNDPEYLVALTQFSDMQKPQFRAWLRLVSWNDKQAITARNVTPLHVAASYGLSSWSEHLIKHGADVNETDSTQNTRIFWASKSGHALLVDLLLQKGAKPDLDGYYGLKPLHVAASRNNSEVVKLLVTAGVSPTTPKTRDIGPFSSCGNAPTSVGHSPLRYASMGGHTESVVEMIPYITVAEDLEGALCWAAQGGHSQLVAALLDNSSVSPDGMLQVRHESVSVTSGGQTALILAAESLDPATVRILLDRGADARKSSSRGLNKYRSPYGLRQPRPQGDTALHSLVKANIKKESESAAKEILIMLLASGADLEARDHEGNTPLLSTIGGRYSPFVSLIPMNMLIAASANPLAADNKGETLLHKACEASLETDAVKRLLELGANHSQRRFSDGATPLHSAVANIHCSDPMIKLLVSHGANVNIRDAQGNTTLLWAVKDSGIREKQTVGALLDLKADVNLQNDLGQTCLHSFRLSTAPFNNNEDKLKCLINTGANLELCDRGGKTVLLHAITESDENKVNALLQYSSPLLTARTYREGKSALHLASHSRYPLKMILMLVDHGADPTWG